MRKIFLFALILSVAFCSFPNIDWQDIGNDDVVSCTLADFMSYIPEGYPVENHEVITDDGFKLNMFRIQKKGTSIESGLHPIFLQHGLDNSAVAWTLNGEEKSFAFILANAGYDVWINSNRGTRFSREHVTLKPNQKEFWAFSFQEMAEYDIPAAIAKVRQVTGMDKMTYFGHSQGTSQMFAALADPAVSPKVAPYLEAFHAFAPVVYLTNTKLQFFELAKVIDWALEPTFNFLNIKHLGLGKCSFDPTLIPKYASHCAKVQCDYDYHTDPYPKVIDYSWYGLAKNASPGGFSLRCIFHYAQLIKQNRVEPWFQKYDHGSFQENMKVYGTPFPPRYDLSNIKSKVFLYMGTADRLADRTDVEKIPAALTNAEVQLIPLEKWGHKAFISAVESGTFYKSIIANFPPGLKHK